MDLYRPASYIQNLDNLLLKSPVYCELLKKIKKTGTIEISGIKGSADSFLAYSIFNDSGRPLLLILPDNDSALRAFYDLQVFFNEGLLLFPALEELEGVRLPPSKELKEQRLSGLKDLLQKKIKVAVFSRQSFTQPVPSKKEFSTAVFKLKKEKELNLLSLVEQLITAGYKMEAFVERKGDISVRGGILDIYSLTEEHPVRIDFFGDNIDTIRVFDLLTQKSTKEIEEIEIYPASEDSFKKGKVTEYLLENTIIYVEEPLSNEFSIPKISDFPVILNQRGTDGINIKTKSFPSFNGNAGLAIKELQKNEAEGTAVFLLFNSNGEQERFAEILTENNAVLSVKYLTGELHGGFHFVEAGVLVVTDNEIFGRYGNSRPATKRRRRFFKDGAPVKSVFEINTGEAVVHENYGIGRFLGLSSLELSGTKKDFVTLEYLNGDKLYIPVEDINKIQKYVGFEETPVLSNLGTSQWEKAKEKVKEDVKKMADDLLLLYAARETLKGHAFPPDTTWQKEFEDSFIYEETKDQLRAISEVKEDMEQGRPIDRLVCGDVGFGKTEVALRAAFKCALEGKQVAFVCPTTILAEQHYKTFKERMAEYPVSIAMLSRFSAKKEQGKTLEKLKAGTVDIVVGTHRLLQEDIVFKDLGMLILDDEQKFGVGQKEKLKKLRKTVYCISLSATPIPRTLYLSLSGIREISNINTPPSGRMAIQTYVIEYNEKIIRGAINKELARGGEVYYVYNKVKTIQRAASRLQRLVPEARVAVAHGQLPGPRLEKIMMDFYEKKYNVLVCSTIIEAGLDNPSANTIIIEDADDLGLSQLYQLRGRVGRSRVQAFAYLTYPKDRSLTDVAMRRLAAIEECDELSMGFSIAMKDLEIRGAGNILGKEQHGQIGRVGLELYMKLLKEAVNAAKGIEEGIPEEKIEIDIKTNAYLPDSYVSDGFLKINIYKDLMAVEDLPGVDKIKEELIDRFGTLPFEAENLLQIVKIRLVAKKAGISSIFESENSINFEMKNTGRGYFKLISNSSDKLNEVLTYFSALANSK